MLNIGFRQLLTDRPAILVVLLSTVLIGGLIPMAPEPLFIVGVLIAILILLSLIFYPNWSLPIIIGAWGISQDWLEIIDTGVAILGQQITASRAIGVIVTVGIVLSLLIRSKDLRFTGDYLILNYLVFFLWVSLSALGWGNRTFGIIFLIRLLSETAVLMGAYYFTSNYEQLRKISVVFLLAGSIMAVYTIFQSVIDTGIFFTGEIPVRFLVQSASEETSRATGSLGGPFVSSIILLVTVAHALSLLQLSSNKKKNSIIWILIVLISSSIFVTVTRSAIIGLVVMFFLWRWLMGKQGLGFRVNATFFIFVVVLVGVSVVGTDALLGRAAELTGGLDIDSYGSGRIGIWRNLLSAFSRLDPLFWVIGGGYGFSYIGAIRAWGIPLVAHNQYLWLLTDTGIIGLFLYATLLIGIVRRLWGIFRNSATAKVLMNPIAAMLALNLVVSVIIAMLWNYTGNIAFNWFYLSSIGAVLGATRLCREKDSYIITNQY